MNFHINKLSYKHPNREFLFQNISFSVSDGEKIALIGSNGTGKSTLLKIIAGDLYPEKGEIISNEKPYYIPQHFGQYDEYTVAEALHVHEKLKALHEILEGNVMEENLQLLNDDWNVEERMLSALSAWDISHIGFAQKMNTLSGGEKTKVFLAGIEIHSPDFILMDEPTNHLDLSTRKQLYEYVKKSTATIIVVSHDRTLLNLLPVTFELTRNKVERYGGNYDFYKTQKEEKLNAVYEQLGEKEKELRKNKKIARETIQRQEKHSSRGEKAGVKKGLPRIVLNNLGSKSENTTSKLKNIHTEKIQQAVDELKDIQSKLPDGNKIKIAFDNSKLHHGKILVTAKEINKGYNKLLWRIPLNLQIRSGERLLIKGKNGSGKTTLIKLLLGTLEPDEGSLERAEFNSVYIDQEYSIIQNELTLLEQVEKFNNQNYSDHQLKMFLHRFQFPAGTWDKTCGQLSGGEKMKLLFCCLQINDKMPDVFALDEPTNNLDIESMEVVTSVIKSYQGTLILISHDEYFIGEAGINKEINLDEHC